MYHVFAGSNYYPSGGAEDFKGSFRGLAECRVFLEGLASNADPNRYQSAPDWFHVSDSELQIVFSGRIDQYGSVKEFDD